MSGLAKRDKVGVVRHAKQAPIRLADLPARYLSIDPGATHCGVARWEVSDTTTVETTHNGTAPMVQRVVGLVEVYERTPEALFIELRELAQDRIGLICCEDFQLQKGRNLQGSRLETPKVIGVIEYLARQAGVRCQLQGPSIKAYVDTWLWTKTGDRLDALASNSHKRDGIRHGLYPALRDPRDREVARLVLDQHARKRG